jgi:hypothetical protein
MRLERNMTVLIMLFQIESLSIILNIPLPGKITLKDYRSMKDRKVYSQSATQADVHDLLELEHR